MLVIKRYSGNVVKKNLTVEECASWAEFLEVQEVHMEIHDNISLSFLDKQFYRELIFHAKIGDNDYASLIGYQDEEELMMLVGDRVRKWKHTDLIVKGKIKEDMKSGKQI